MESERIEKERVGTKVDGKSHVSSPAIRGVPRDFFEQFLIHINKLKTLTHEQHIRGECHSKLV